MLKVDVPHDSDTENFEDVFDTFTSSSQSPTHATGDTESLTQSMP